MKKLVFMFVAVAAISFASCGNKANNAAPVDTDSVEVATVDSVASDSTAADSTAAAPVDSTVANAQ